MTTPYETARDRLLDAALSHVPFDGWTKASFRAAIAETGMEPALARSVCPRGAVDLALLYHKRGDGKMLERLRQEDLSGLKFRDKIACAVRFRLEALDDKEAVRRAVTLFSLPPYAADGARAIWTTCDLIWDALGDGSDDLNWYTKRATLSGVYSSTLLYWLGDDSPGHQRTWDFLDRRIADVMRIEEMKAMLRKSPTLSRLMAGPNWLAGRVKPPAKMPGMDLPGMMGPRP